MRGVVEIERIGDQFFEIDFQRAVRAAGAAAIVTAFVAPSAFRTRSAPFSTLAFRAGTASFACAIPLAAFTRSACRLSFLAGRSLAFGRTVATRRTLATRWAVTAWGLLLRRRWLRRGRGLGRGFR